MSVIRHILLVSRNVFLSFFVPSVVIVIIIMSVFLGNCDRSTVWNENGLLSLVVWGVGGIGWLVGWLVGW
jgi:hypothetical protein